MINKKILELLQLILVCTPGFLSGPQVNAQTTPKEYIYEHHEVAGYTFDGAVISKDGRKPEVDDRYWQGLLEKEKAKMVPFEYVLRIKELDQNGGIIHLNEVHLNEIPLPDGPDRLGSNGPLWYAGFDSERGLLCLWRYEGIIDPRGGEEAFDLFYWNVKQKKFMNPGGNVVTCISPEDDGKFQRFNPPKSILSPSGKFLAVLAWRNHRDSSVLLQNHVEVIKLLGENVSLEESQFNEIIPKMGGKSAKIREFRWHPGDRLECLFTESKLSLPSQIKSINKTPIPNKKQKVVEHEHKTFADVDKLFVN